jgi:glycosyltransferase involved in cell wall biosynthesis
LRERARLGPIRVLRIITRLNVGGPALHASLLSTRLDPERFQTTLAVGQESAGEAAMADLGRLPPSLRPVAIPSLRREISPLADARALAALVALTRRVRPHIVHTHLAKAGSLGRVAARLAGVPVVVHTFHGTVFSGYFGERASRVYLASERALGHLTTRLVAISPAVRAELLALRVAPAAKIVEIPLGLDLDPFLAAPSQAVARERLRLQPDARYVGIAGRLVPVKDVGTFIRAFAIVAAERADVTALIVGDGPEREALERMTVDLGIGGRCRFMGWVADMSALYAAVDVMALTSVNEGTPVTLIEAMAAGRTVVATAVGGVPDVVAADTGLLVPPGDPAAFAQALLRALDREPAPETARRAVVLRYSASRLVADIERLYLELIATRAGR